MALTQSAHVLLVARRDPQDPVRRILKGAGYAVVPADSPSSVVRTAERVHPAVIVVEPGALGPGAADSLVSFADANQIPVVREWSGSESLLREVERVLKRPEQTGRESFQIVVGLLCVDLTGHQASVGGSPLGLTAREFDLLCHLARHPGWVYSRQELLEQVWGYEFGDPRVVTVHMANLRKKLDAAAPGCELIQTVRNVGYKFVVPVTSIVDASSRRTEGGIAAELALIPPVPPTDERRLVTVLFVHVAGLSALAEAVDLESLREIIDSLFARLDPCVERYGGILDRLGPDTFMALFGAPVAHDNDAERGARAAIDVRGAVAHFGAEKGVEGLSAHMGIDTGVVIAAALGGAHPYSAVGEPVDAASCLAQLAGPGEILAGSETLRSTGGILAAEPVGKAKVRGRTEELSYHRVNGVDSSVVSGRTARGIESVLVGRDEQLALLRGSLDRLEEGVGGVVFVVGEAGVGKSRLKTEISYEAVFRGLKWLEARPLSYGQNISYLPVKEMLQQDCGIELGDEGPERERKLRQRVLRLFADKAGDLLPALGNLLGTAATEPGTHDPLMPEEESARKVLLATLSRYITRVATEQPLVLAFEDVHWLDRSSVVLVENLMSLAAKSPFVLCLVGRAGKDSPTEELLAAAHGDDESRRVVINLTPLPPPQTQRLVRNLLSGSEIDPAVMRTIERRSEGNPFFVEEIVHNLVESGSLQQDEKGNWQAATAGGRLVIPTTIQGVIAARIDRLPEAPRQELLRASVIGRSFLRSLLGRLSSADPTELDRSLEHLRDHQLIFVKRSEPDVEYAFKHALVQETAYGTMLVKRRKELHRQVAEVVHDQFHGRIKDLYGILAYHYTRAEDWHRAQEFLVKAGDQSVGLAADSEAVAQYEEAMSALLRAFDESWGTPGAGDQVSWFVAATEPFWLARCLGDLLDSAEVFYQRVSATCGASDPRTLAATTILAGAYFQRGDYGRASSLVESALVGFEQSEREEDRSMTRLLLVLGLCRLNSDRFAEGEDIFQRALALEDKKPSPDPGLLQDLYIFLSSSHFFTGRHDDLRRVTEEALKRFEIEGTPRYWMLLINLCSANLVDGNWDEAAAQAEECVEGIASPYLRAAAARHLGEVRFAQGAYLEAEEHLKYAVAVFEELGEPVKRFEALADLAETQLQAGKVDRAEETARRVLRLMEATSANHSEAPVMWTLAGVEMARGNLTDADSFLQRGAEIVREKYSSRHPFCAELCFRRAQLRRRQRRLTEAESDLDQAIAVMSEIGGGHHPRIGQMRAEWEATAAVGAR